MTRSYQQHRRVYSHSRFWLESLEDRQMLAIFSVTNLNDGPVSAAGDLPGSLRQAVFDANSSPGPDEIVWSTGLNGSVVLTGGELRVTDDVTITALGAGISTLNASVNSRVLRIDNSNTTLINVSLSNIRITGGLVDGDGGGIWNSENLTIADSVITGNATADNSVGTGAGGGGGIFSTNGQLTITNSTITGNSTGDDLLRASRGGHGGGIYASGAGSLLVLQSSTISGNRTGFGRSSGNGGGIMADGVVVAVNDSVISSNSTGNALAGGQGGGLYSRGGTLTISHSTISSNITGNGTSYSGGSGGGISVADCAGNGVVIESSTISGNSTGRGGSTGSFGGHGGGIQSFCRLTMSRSTISGNSTGNGANGPYGYGGAGNGGDGGGMVTFGDRVTITYSTISNNRTGNGGQTFKGQGGRGGIGGGIWFGGSGQLFELHNSTVSNNTTGAGWSGANGGDGAGIIGFVNVASVSVRNSTITGNSTGPGGTGGGIHTQSPSVTIENSIVAGNSASSAPDLVAGGTVRYSLIGNNSGSGLAEAPVGMADANGNLVGGPIHGVIDAGLGPLEENGGPTHTRLPLNGSPAIDAGDPTAVAGMGNTPLFDQRSSPYIRVLGGRMDIGAVESRPATAVDGDFNDDGLYDCLDIDQLVAAIAAGTNNATFDLTGDGLVNLADRDAWLAEGGANNPVQTGGNPFLLGDANLDAFVDGSDFGIWNANKFTANAAWCSGDFSADGFVDGSDFGVWNTYKFTSSMSLPMLPGSAEAPRAVSPPPHRKARIPVARRAADPQAEGSSAVTETALVQP